MKTAIHSVIDRRLLMLMIIKFLQILEMCSSILVVCFVVLALCKDLCCIEMWCNSFLDSSEEAH